MFGGCLSQKQPQPVFVHPPPPPPPLVIVVSLCHKTKMSKTWSSNCKGRQHLLALFKLFLESGGKEGINYDEGLTLKPKKVKEGIFDTDPILREYKRDRFPDNFRDTIHAFKVDLKKEQGRRKGEFDYFVLFYLTCNLLTPVLLFCHPGDKVFEGKESPRKKLKDSNHKVSFEPPAPSPSTDGKSIISRDLVTPRSEATSTTSSEAAFFTFDAEDPPSSSPDVHNLVAKMKETKISVPKKKKATPPSKFLQIQHPFLLTEFHDAEKRNKMINLEVHLPSCAFQDDLEHSLEIKEDGHQYLVLKEKMSIDFMFPELFKEKLPDNMSADDKSSLYLQRKDTLIAMQAKYAGDVKGEEEEDDNIFMMSSYKLPFVCDDLFSQSETERYPGTMAQFTWWNVFDDPDTVDDNVDESINIGDSIEVAEQQNLDFDDENNWKVANAVDKMKVFVVRLVAAEKVKEKIVKPVAQNQTVNKIVKRRSRRNRR